MFKLEQIALIFYICASTAGVLIIKNFFNGVSYQNIQDFIVQLVNPSLVLGVILYVGGFLAWLYVLSKMDLNVAYPVAVTLSFVAILILSTLVLKERITLNIALGTLLCLIGIVVILR